MRWQQSFWLGQWQWRLPWLPQQPCSVTTNSSGTEGLAATHAADPWPNPGWDGESHGNPMWISMWMDIITGNGKKNTNFERNDVLTIVLGAFKLSAGHQSFMLIPQYRIHKWILSWDPLGSFGIQWFILFSLGACWRRCIGGLFLRSFPFQATPSSGTPSHQWLGWQRW